MSQYDYLPKPTGDAYPSHPGCIEELALPYDPTEPLAKVKKRKRIVRGRIISLVITVVIMLAIYLWQRSVFPPGAWVVYGVVVGLSLLWLAIRIVGYVLAKRDLATVGQGVAVRIGRAGVQIAAEFAPWSQISALRVVNGKLGRSSRFRVEYVTDRGPAVAAIDMNQLSVLPATLDTTARAYSAGRHGVDLSALDA